MFPSWSSTISSLVLSQNSPGRFFKLCGQFFHVSPAVRPWCQAYFLSEGSLTYTWGEKKLSFSEKDKFGWLVEMSIWTPWVHVGELSTRTVSNVEIMQIEPFFECICRSLDVLQLARSYAEEFVANRNSYAAVTDLWHPDQVVERSESLPSKVPKRNLFLSGDFGSVVPLQ